ncbi:hypothetical protein Tcan_14642 [Toxocara canis]|uniref:Uncharacterized protein n=1 Tax=Toxocara canis TaxID=6265 RepID=A0A0B2V5L2_TOXCA|nr:hypothetical protein Tcan_14642 [Toxocara canis]
MDVSFGRGGSSLLLDCLSSASSAGVQDMRMRLTFQIIFGGCSVSKRKTPASVNAITVQPNSQKTTQLTAEEMEEQRQRREAQEYHQRVGTRFTQTHNFD